MGFGYSLPLRIISTFVLGAFLWTFGGLFDIAYAINGSRQPNRNSQSSSVDGQWPRTPRAEERFGKAAEELEKIVGDTGRAGREKLDRDISGKAALN